MHPIQGDEWAADLRFRLEECMARPDLLFLNNIQNIEIPAIAVLEMALDTFPVRSHDNDDLVDSECRQYSQESVDLQLGSMVSGDLR